jgi:hypothetical protein
MILSGNHIEAIKAAALQIEYGSITIQISVGHLDIIVEKRMRLETETNKKPLLVNKRR